MKTMIMIAASIFFLSGCAETFKRLEQEEAQRNAVEAAVQTETISRVVDAQVKGFVVCSGKDQCEKAFKLTKLYIMQNADYKVARSDDMSISTHAYNVYNRDIAYQERFRDLTYMSALKIPVKGGGAAEKIVINVDCGGYRDPYTKGYPKCVDNVIKIYNEFAPFIESQL
ncbi:MAG: hypothetical protein Q8K74_05070 [Candidatus Nitrotoga sp.]|nr:hypothetical protein [Candidatus Nitrotoga sp.]MDP1855409.1 hypothetical protein [Candidatus Nitrotoga sp.]